MAFHSSTRCKHLDCATHGAAGVFADAFAERRAEHDHDAVADKLVQEAAILLDDFAHHGEIAVEPAEDVFRWHACSGGGEAADVGEEDRGDALFAGQHDRVAILPDFGGDVGGDVAFEQAHQLMALGFHGELQAALFDRAVTESRGQGGEQSKVRRRPAEPRCGGWRKRKAATTKNGDS